MAIFKVEGGRRLKGEITPQGAKNEALQILCATLLTKERVVVHNVPQILDIMQLIESHQYILSHFYESLGLQTHDQMKKERLITAEISYAIPSTRSVSTRCHAVCTSTMRIAPGGNRRYMLWTPETRPWQASTHLANTTFPMLPGSFSSPLCEMTERSL